MLLSFLCTLCVMICACFNTFADGKIVVIGQRPDDLNGLSTVNSFGSDQIWTFNSGNTGTSGLSKLLPNVEENGSGRNFTGEFKIRGLDDANTVVKLDGSRSNFRGEYKGRNFINPFFLKSIAVQKGSNSVMDGSGSIAGTVYMDTKNAADFAVESGKNSGTAGGMSYNSNGNAVNYNTAIYSKSSKLDIVGMYSYNSNANYTLANGTTLDQSSGRTNNGMLKATYTIDNTSSLTLSNAIFDDKSQTTSNPFRTGSVQTAGYPIDKTTRNNRTNLVYKKTNGNWLDLQVSSFFDKTFVDEHTTSGSTRHDETNYKSLGMNVLNKSKIELSHSSSHNLSYGGEFFNDSQEGVRGGTNRSGFYPDAKYSGHGIFLQDDFRYHNLNILSGVRHDEYSLSMSDGSIKNDASKITKKFGVSYTFGNIFTPYYRYSEGFRAPLIKEAFASGTIASMGPGGNLNLLSNNSIKPEFSKNTDIGFTLQKNTIFSTFDNMKFTANYFTNDISNFITQDAVAIGSAPHYAFQYQNIALAKLHGFETELTYSINGYAMYAGYSVTQGKDITNDTYLSQIPPQKFVLQLSKKLNLTSTMDALEMGLRGITAGSVPKSDLRTYSHNGIPYDAEALQFAYPTSGYTTFDIFAKYDLKKQNSKTSVLVSANNIFNKDYQTQTSFIPSKGRSFVISISNVN